jgi:hypothetical protein
MYLGLREKRFAELIKVERKYVYYDITSKGSLLWNLMVPRPVSSHQKKAERSEASGNVNDRILKS